MQFLNTDIPRLGLGCWPLAGPFFKGDQPLGYANADDAESTRTIHAALEAGVRLFDVAGVYGAGHGERLLGRALAGRAEALVVTKIGMAFDEATKQVTGDQSGPADVRPAIERCLARLGRDRIDVVLLHQNDMPVEVAEPVFEAMARARDAGLVRAFGWSTDFPHRVAATASREGFVAVEHAMNVLVDVPTMCAAVERVGLTPLIRSPLAMGVLGGRFDAGSVLPADDIRSTNESWRGYFADARVAPAVLANLDAVRELLMTDGRTLAQGALCWLLARSPRGIPLPGARTVAQMVDNAGALAFGPLPEAVMTEIESCVAREPEGEPRSR